jgi:hypothetical protein
MDTDAFPMYYILYDMFGVVKYAGQTSPGPPRARNSRIALISTSLSSPGRWRARAAAARPYRSGVHEHAERQGDRGRYHVRTDPGHAVFFALRGALPPQFLAAVEVGALPDMITFSEDGTDVLTADEGEPDPSYTIDPPGSVSIIEIARIGTPRAVRRVGFERFDRPEARAVLDAKGVRIFGPGATAAQDRPGSSRDTAR